MKTYMLFSTFLAALILLSAGCGEGPLYMEESGALASDDSPDSESSSDSDHTSEADRSFDPDQQREIEEEKEEQEKEEEEEAVKKDGSKIADILAEYIYKKEFEKAVEKFEEYAAAVEVTANAGMGHENPSVQEGYKIWHETLYKLVKYLKEGTDELEKKKNKAQMMLDEASQAKRAAEFAKSRE